MTDETNDPVPRGAQLADAIAERIRRYVVLSFRDGRGEGLGFETPLVSSGIVDSAGVLQLVDWLESSFGIAIEDEAVGIDNFESLASLARMVRARLPDAPDLPHALD